MKKSNVFNDQPPVDLRRANRRLVRRSRRDSRLFATPAYDSKKLTNSFPPQWPETDLLPTLALASRAPVPLDGDKTIYIEPHTPAAPAAITSISRELVRCHFEELLANLADPSFDVDARIQGLHSDLDDFQSELRERDLSRSTLLANAAAEKVGERPVSEMDAGATRQFATTVKACWQAELKAHKEFEDPLRVASDLLGRFQISPKNGLIPPFVSVSTAVETAMTSKSEEMRRKLSATGKLLLEHFGDIALELVPQRM